MQLFPGKMPNIYNAMIGKGRDTIGQQINVTPKYETQTKMYNY